jgi:hypothetical protein
MSRKLDVLHVLHDPHFDDKILKRVSYRKNIDMDFSPYTLIIEEEFIMICGNCGIELPDKAKFCGNCGVQIQQTNQSEHTAPTPQPYASPIYKQPASARSLQSQPITQKVAANNLTGITLSDGEVIIRTYHCTSSKPSLLAWFAVDNNGYITVTNKRVIYRSLGKSSHGISEILMETYQGFLAFYGQGWRILRLILGGLMTLLGIYLLSKFSFGVALLPLVIGIYLIVTSRNVNLAIKIYSSANESPITILNISKVQGLTGQGAFFDGFPTSETDPMMRELGAMIMDIKAMGDTAIEKWSV